MPPTVQTAPRLTCEDAVRIAADFYGLNAAASALPSERDQNFLLKVASESQFVLKIANSEESFDFLDLQNRMVQYLSSRRIALEFPRIISGKNGKDIATIETGAAEKHFVRLFTWLDGECLATVQSHGRKLLASLGRALGQMDAALADFSHPAAHRAFYWDLRRADIAREHARLLPEDRRPIVEGFFSEWAKIDWSRLRSSVIHNDANDYNVLVQGAGTPAAHVSAILDYGDVVHTATICELAVTLAYVMLDKPDPIGAAAHVITAYHETYPLTEYEIDSLYTLIATRLCCSVCYAAHRSATPRTTNI